MPEKQHVIFLMGPTASGKTACAVRLVQQFPIEIISVDSALVYRGMDIGTSKPDQETLSVAPHHLIDICDPRDAYSAARFRDDALRVIQEVLARGNIPLLVGGTMLYFRALSQGFTELPSADAAIRQALERQLQENGSQALHTQLALVDRESAQRIHPNDPQRIVRALEVYQLTGKPMSELWHTGTQQNAFPYQVVKLAVCPAERSLLHERIALRFRDMVDQGFVREVEQLKAQAGMHLELPSMRAVGYRQVWQHLDGVFGLDEMIDKGIVATRQLAKRQLTWLRAEKDLRWIDAAAKDAYEQVAGHLRFLFEDRIE